MILQELSRLYEHLISDKEKIENGEVFFPGFSAESIGFRIILRKNGEFVKLEDLRQKEGNKLYAIRCIVPKWEGKRTSSPKPYFLWDNCKYLIGRERDNKKDHSDKQENFIKYIDEVCAVAGKKPEFAKAVRRFVADSNQQEQILSDANIDEMIESQSFVGFSILEASHFLLTDNEEIQDVWRKYLRSVNEEPDKVKEILIDGKTKQEKDDIFKRHTFPEYHIDLVSGQPGPVYSVHPTIKRAIGSSGKNDIPFISFNAKSFCSYNKKSNYNAPVSRYSAFAFTTAINYLMSSREHNLFVGDTRILFWAEKNRKSESMFGLVIGALNITETEDDTLRVFVESIRKARIPPEIGKDTSRFYVLGLAPNSARVTVKYWYNGTVAEFSSNLSHHINDLSIVGPQDIPFPSLIPLMRQTAPGLKDENIPSTHIAAVFRSVIEGHPYPPSILPLLLDRMRHDKDDRQRRIYKIGYYRAAFIKAVLNRNYHKELPMALDPKRKEPAYLCGRLFAILEKTQKDAQGERINATIKDRYFSSASTNPRVVFPQLIRLSQNHLKKVRSENPSWAVHNERLTQEIMSGIDTFPAFLTIAQQGEFAIGYYHQVQDFYTKKDKGDEGNGTD